MLYSLLSANLLVEISSDEKGAPSRFMPAESISNLSVGTMVDRLEAQGSWRLSLPLDKYYNDKWAQMLRARRDYLDSMRGIMLKDL